MPKNYEIKFEDAFALPNPGLRSYFDIVRKGQPEDYETPFAKGQSIEEILSDWDKILISIKDKYPWLWEFENDLGAKVGPMSIMRPLSERMEDIDHYYDDILLPSQPISDSAIKAVLSEFSKIKGMHLRSQQKTVDKMKKSTNSGSPYFTKRRVVVSKTLFCDMDGRYQILNLPEETQLDVWTWADNPDQATEWIAVAVLGWRGQEGGPTEEDTKQRVVWMFPFAVNICELQFYQPLIESCQKFNLVPAWVSMDAVDREITLLFDTKGPDDDVICTDFSKFDQHFNHDMQSCARSIERGLLDHSYLSDNWLNNVFPIKYEIPLAYDYGKVRVGKHGMGSGSGGTNADETLAHRALQYEAALNAKSRLNPHSMCLGDDGVLSYPGITVDDVIRSYTAHGQEMNASKQYVSKHECVFLRRIHSDSYRINGICVGVYSTKRALGRLKKQERFYDPEKWSAEMVEWKFWSVLENCKYHPLREEFALFCMKRDKYRLGLDIPGFLDNIESRYQEAVDLMPDLMGYTKSMQHEEGVKSWWIYNFLKSQR